MTEPPASAPGRPRADLLAAAVAGAGAATWLAALLATFAGRLRPGAGIVALLSGLLCAVAVVRAARRHGSSRVSWPAVLALAGFAVISIRQFGWLVFERDGVLLTLLPSNFGDLPLHWTYIRHMAGGASFWPENPILTGERLRYPLGVDLLAAVFVQLGANVPAVLVAMGLAGAVLTALALLRWGGALGVAGFVFAGGLAGFQFLWTGRLEDYQHALAWKSLFLTLFVPQRGFLLALPIGLLLLWSFRQRLLRDERGLPPWVEGVLWAVLPVIHMHSFAFVSLLGAWWALGSHRVRALLPSLAVALVPASWAVLQVTDGLRAGSIVGLQPGWMIGKANPLAFLLVNFGAWLPLALTALVVAVRRRRAEELRLLVPPLALFATLFLVRAAPWDWDNTKLMVWCYLVSLPPIGLLLERLRWPLRAALLVLLLFSGAVSTLGASFGRAPRLEVLDRAEYGGVCAALRPLGRDERVATAQAHDHPVALCGQPVVAGYSGHLWSHGLDARAVERDLRRLMAGEEGWRERARALGARYVFWGRREQSAFPRSKRPWSYWAPVVASGSWGALYRVE